MARTSTTYGINPASIQRAAEDLRRQGDAEADRIAQRARDQLESEVSATASFDGVNPRVFDAIEAVVIDDPDGARVQLRLRPGASQEEEIAAAVAEYGRRGYYVYPVNKQALKWDDLDGKRFAKQVYIPAIEGFQTLRRTRDRVYQRLRRGTV